MLDVRPVGKITVVDDDQLDREELMDELRDYHFEPTAIDGRYGKDIDRLLADVQSQGSSFVICDHRLQPAGFASFNGAAVVSKLVALKIPAMLLTMFQSTNRMELRECRHAIPVIIGRDKFQPEEVAQYAEICRLEIENKPVDERKPHRVLIRVEGIRDFQGRRDIDAVIPSWRPDHAVSIPEARIACDIRDKIRPGDRMLGWVNIDALEEDDLFFKEVDELLPDDVVVMP